MNRTILDELNDPALFAPHFKGDSWDAWKAFPRTPAGPERAAGAANIKSYRITIVGPRIT